MNQILAFQNPIKMDSHTNNVKLTQELVTCLRQHMNISFFELLLLKENQCWLRRMNGSLEGSYLIL